MKNIKKALALFVAIMMLGALLTGCGKGGVFVNVGYDGGNGGAQESDKEGIVGAWTFTQEYNGQIVGTVIEFTANGIVNVYSMYGDTVVLISSDSYEVTGNTLTVDGEPGSFKLHDGKLTLTEGDQTMTLEPYYGDLPEGGSDFDEDDFDFDFDEDDFDFDFDEDFDFDFDEDFDFDAGDFDLGDFDFDYNGGATVAPSGLVGNWACTQNRNGSVIVLGMVIRADGTMDSNTIVDGVVTHSATARYEIQGNQIIAYVDGDTEGDPASFELNGNTLTITEGGTSMVFERVG